jgi:hypothetical protein
VLTVIHCNIDICTSGVGELFYMAVLSPVAVLAARVIMSAICMAVPALWGETVVA